MAEDIYDVGMATRRKVLGDAHVDRASGTITAFDETFQRMITEAAWGRTWSSDGLPMRERSMITLALLAGLGHWDEFQMHVRATRNTGATEADIAEVLMHVAVYAGVPAANHAIKLAKTTLAAEKEAAEKEKED